MVIVKKRSARAFGNFIVSQQIKFCQVALMILPIVETHFFCTTSKNISHKFSGRQIRNQAVLRQ
jgi:hypothetical protein